MAAGDTTLSRLLATAKSSFGIGPKAARATLDASGLTAARTLALPDAAGTLALLGQMDFLSALSAAESSVTTTATATVSRMHVCSGTSANYTVTLPAASGNAGKLIGFRMSPSLTRFVTLDGSGSETIDGATTRVMWAEESAILLCDGSNWFKVGGKSRALRARRPASGSHATTPNTHTILQLRGTADDPSTRMCVTTDTITVARAGVYRAIGYGAGQTAGVASGQQPFLLDVYLNGSSYRRLCRCPLDTFSVGAAGGATDLGTLAAGDLLTMYAYVGASGAGTTATEFSGPSVCSLTVEEVSPW